MKPQLDLLFIALVVAIAVFQMVVVLPLQESLNEHRQVNLKLEKQVRQLLLIHNRTRIVQQFQQVPHDHSHQTEDVDSHEEIDTLDDHHEEIDDHHEESVDTDERFSYDDFEDMFGVKPLHHIIEDPDITPELDQKDILLDAEYTDDPQSALQLQEKYQSFILEGSHEMEDRRRFYVKHTGSERGYGLYCKVKLSKGEPLSVYTGYLSTFNLNTDYTWGYPTLLRSKNESDLGIDGRTMGNYMRFVNHNEQLLNVKSVMVPVRNRWIVLYIADRDIEPDEELYTSYGSDYFTSRDLQVS
ncbi:hypothetical protein EDD86DRAFT_210885 [Gorgonomyces haynaldii]|nr:hypothetical protein EDD86DRAFT_210885 [Gorgonomyces haynaldii]